MRMLRCYIAGPYSADSEDGVQANVSRAIRAAVPVILAGHYPIVPHGLSFHVDFAYLDKTGEALAYDWWLAWCLAELETCDAVLCIGTSPGTLVECAYAQKMGIPVVDSVAELANVAREAA